MSKKPKSNTGSGGNAAKSETPRADGVLNFVASEWLNLKLAELARLIAEYEKNPVNHAPDEEIIFGRSRQSSIGSEGSWLNDEAGQVFDKPTAQNFRKRGGAFSEENAFPFKRIKSGNNLELPFDMYLGPGQALDVNGLPVKPPPPLPERDRDYPTTQPPPAPTKSEFVDVALGVTQVELNVIVANLRNLAKPMQKKEIRTQDSKDLEYAIGKEYYRKFNSIVQNEIPKKNGSEGWEAQEILPALQKVAQLSKDAHDRSEDIATNVKDKSVFIHLGNYVSSSAQSIIYSAIEKPKFALDKKNEANKHWGYLKVSISQSVSKLNPFANIKKKDKVKGTMDFKEKTTQWRDFVSSQPVAGKNRNY